MEETIFLHVITTTTPLQPLPFLGRTVPTLSLVLNSLQRPLSSEPKLVVVERLSFRLIKHGVPVAHRFQPCQLKTGRFYEQHSRLHERLRVIVRENRAVPKDWGQPMSFIFSPFKTQLIRLTLMTLTRFPGVSLTRLTTP